MSTLPTKSSWLERATDFANAILVKEFKEPTEVKAMLLDRAGGEVPDRHVLQIAFPQNLQISHGGTVPARS